MLNVTLTVPTASTPPFLGLSLAYQSPPTLLSVSGCQDGSGLLCQPARSVLRFTGRGLADYSDVWKQLRLEPASPSPSSPPPVLIVLDYVGSVIANDSLLVLDLRRAALTNALLPAHYGGVPLLLSFCSTCLPGDPLSSNALPVSFEPLPPPDIIAISSGNCDGGVTQQSLLNCRPEVSTLSINARFIYWNITEVSVGSDSPGVGFTRCRPLQLIQSGFVLRMDVALPLPPHYEPGVLYDVRVRVGEQTTTVQRAFAWTVAPSISAINRCIITGLETDSLGGNCQPGQTVTIFGSRFPADSSLQVAIAHPDLHDLPTVQCLQPQRVNSSSVVCLLPTPPTAFYYRELTVQLLYGDGSFLNRSQLLRLPLYAAPDAPRITRVSGCGLSVRPLQLELCGLHDVLTVSGERLLGAGNHAPLLGIAFEVMPGWSNSSFRCRLPDWTSSLPLGVPLLVTTWIEWPQPGQRIHADAFTVSYLPDKQLAASSSSLPAAYFEVLVALAVVTVMVLLALLPSLRRASRQDSTVVSLPTAAAAAAAAAALPGEGEQAAASPAALQLYSYPQQDSAARQLRSELAEGLLPHPAS